MVDQAPKGMLRASLANEGKIHLGHLYANDSSFRTSRLMLEAALAFAPCVEKWLGRPIPWASMRSNPFTYLVARDSMVTQERLFDHYARLNREYLAVGRSSGRQYLGEQPETIWTPIPIPSAVNSRFVEAAIATPEVSLSPTRFRELLLGAIEASQGIETMYSHRVKSVSRTPRGFRVEGTTAGGDGWQRQADVVVNCLWDGRLEIDRQLGIMPKRAWVYRLKYGVLADLPRSLAGLPSMTIVLGAFGDIVTNPHNNTVYLSWYPVGMRGWSSELRTPSQWDPAISGNPDAQTARAVANETLKALDAVVPGLKDCRNIRVAAGVIFSWGETDITDIASGLHARSAIGLHAHIDYFSIDTGKFTCAPLFARHLIGELTQSI